MAEAPQESLTVVVVTGLSGSGKSTALNVFEDLGYFCVDGLPAAMLPKLASLFLGKDAKHRGLAIGMDLRQHDFLDQWIVAAQELAANGVTPRVLFVEAKNDVIMRRYATTRRPHPLEGELGLEQALAKERAMLAPLRRDAELVLDTSEYSIHDLRRMIQERFMAKEAGGHGMRVHVISFGFKYGVPAEADLVFDLRFLPNPYFVPELRPMSGKDAPVAEYVLESEPGRTFKGKFLEFLQYMLPLYAAEGRYRIAVAIGCTGGRHRSVALSELLFATLRSAGYSVTLEHRHFNLG
ncbi:MAG: RNase adaptor protein RapZ [Desulfovibrionaceae bacterium CG1_02_65_16]|nr:MAG: RNase adaptor protein RapZ [Desulfovibrionaceae bacterium CG1_02_65_16]